MTNGYEMSNGMKVNFQGSVTPEKYAQGNWYVEGVGSEIKLISEKDSDIYFSKRERGSQIGAWASKQSSEIPNIGYLRKRILFYEKKFADSVVPRPKYWRGIFIQPQNFEFWTQGEYRIHEREFYYKKSEKWLRKKLSP